VTLVLKDGRSLEESVVAHRGDARNPVSQGELAGKFISLASDTLGEERSQQVIDTVYRLDGLGDVRELTRLLVGNQER
jgi:2-methylcitrate dehydratase PrpD